MTAATSKLGADMDELISLLREIRPSYGDVGSRDVDVRKRQEQIDRAIELLARQPAAPSVEQDERGAVSRIACTVDGDEIAAIRKASELMCEMGYHAEASQITCFLARTSRAASTSANVAQGAEAVAWREEAQKLFTRCKLWPEKSDDGFMALLELRNHFEKLLKNDALTAPPARTAPTDDARDAIRRLALEESVQIIETYRIPVGNSPAGEMAAGWTLDALHEIRDAIRELTAGDTK
jgi:hypothetical protein